MTKVEAKRWACGMAADLLSADVQAGYVPTVDEPNYELKQRALEDLVRELQKRGKPSRKG